MHDFGKIVYLDVQKTGSTYVSRFLQNNLLVSEITLCKHCPVKRVSRNALYFISVREPLQLYISLYQYGLEGRGGLADRFAEHGLSSYYQPDSTLAFEKWLDFMLSPDSSRYFGIGYQRSPHTLFGLLSFRFLRLSFVAPVVKLRRARSRQSLLKIYNRHKIHDHVIKTETLNQDLEKLLDSKVGSFFKPREQVKFYLQNSERINTSKFGAAFQPENISPDLVAYLKEREWFLYEQFYPQ